MERSISRHISIDDKYLKKIEPYLDMHGGNFGDAIKGILKEMDTDSVAINKNLLDWLLKEMEDILIPEDLLDRLVNPILINSIGKFEEHIKNLFRKWDVSITLKCDNEILPSEIFTEIRGNYPQIKFVACLISQFFAKNSEIPLSISSFSNSSEFIKIEFKSNSKNETYKNLKKYFGGMEETVKTIKHNSRFWKFLINMYVLNNYNMVYMHKNDFEDFIAGIIPSGDLIFEDKPIQDISLNQLLNLIKINYETSKIIERADIEGDSIILLHNYRNNIAKEKMKTFFINILEQAGHIYDAKMTSNLIILNPRT